ncbi:MAG TPA: hypothetical protein VLW25_11170, partial [Bryobacteraceae bacterium]|nr:hypothetical protein [Bryobacteraceae bacterium]
IAAANQRPIAHLEAGDTLVIPVSYAAPRTVAHHISRAAAASRPVHHATASAGAPVRRTVPAGIQKAAAPAVHKTAPTSLHKPTSTPYKTASLASKHSATTN